VRLVLSLSLALALSACASTRHKLTVTTLTSHSVLMAVRDTEVALVCGRAGAPANCIGPDLHRALSLQLAAAFDLDSRILRAVRTSNSTPPSVGPMLTQVDGIIHTVVSGLPEGPQKQALSKWTK
jgi:hypothetical protein